MTKIGGSSPTTPTPGSGSSEPTEGATPKKPFDDVMNKKGDKDGERKDDESGKKGDAKDAAAKKKAEEVAKKGEVKRPKSVAEYRAQKALERAAEKKEEPPSADTLAQQNPALAKPMDVKRPGGVEAASRVEGMIPKEKLDQIVEKVRVGVNRAGATEMQFDLKSKVLGGLTLKVSTMDGRVYATFLADQPGVKDLVDLNAAALEKALRDRGLAIGEIKTEMRHGLVPDEQQRGQQDQGDGGQDPRSGMGEDPRAGGHIDGGGGSAGAPAEERPKDPDSSTDYVV